MIGLPTGQREAKMSGMMEELGRWSTQPRQITHQRAAPASRRGILTVGGIDTQFASARYSPWCSTHLDSP